MIELLFVIAVTYFTHDMTSCLAVYNYAFFSLLTLRVFFCFFFGNTNGYILKRIIHCVSML